MQQPIKLLKARDLGETLNESIKFIRLYFPAFVKPILFLILPLLLIASYGFVEYFKLITTMMKTMDPSTMGGSVASVFFGYVGYLLAAMLQMLTVAEAYLALEKSEDGTITASDIFQGIKNHFFRFLGFLIMITAILIFISVVIVGVGVLLFKLTPFTMPFFVIAGFIALMYTMVVLSITPFIYLREKLGILDAISRSFYLVKGHWWSTFGIIFVASMAVQILSTVFVIPFYGMFFMKMIHSVQDGGASSLTSIYEFTPLQSISFIFMMVGITILSTLIYVVTTMRYYSLVEIKDGEGLLADIQQIGNQDTQGDPV